MVYKLGRPREVTSTLAVWPSHGLSRDGPCDSGPDGRLACIGPLKLSRSTSVFHVDQHTLAAEGGLYGRVRVREM